MDKVQLDRAKLLGALQAVAPALYKDDSVAVLSAVQITGGLVRAFDGRVVMEHPLEGPSDLSVGVPARPLLRWLKSVKVPSVSITVDGPKATFLAKGRRTNLVVIPEQDFKDVHPAYLNEGYHWYDDPAGRLSRALSVAAHGMGKDETKGWQAGVTVLSNGGQTTLLSSDDVTCSKLVVPVDLPDHMARSTVVPPRMAEIVAANKVVPTSWYFGEGVVLATYPDGLFIGSQTLGSGKPAVLQGPYKLFDWAEMVPIPDCYSEELETVCSVLTDKVSGMCSLGVTGGVMHLDAKSSQGDAYQELSIEGAHADVSVRVSPMFLTRMLKYAAQIQVSASGVQLYRPYGDDFPADMYTLVSVITDEPGDV